MPFMSRSYKAHSIRQQQRYRLHSVRVAFESKKTNRAVQKNGQRHSK